MQRNLSKMKIVYIAEGVKKYGKLDIFNRNLEQESYYNTKIVLDSLNDIFSEVVYYDSPAKFIKKIHKFDDYIIFPNWFGKISRVRNSYLPTVCEMNNLKYIGADGHCMMLTSDKYLSKIYMKKFGLATSNCVFIKSSLTKHSISKIQQLHFPIIVKPNFEGSSMGIANENVCYTLNEACDLIKKLIRIFKEGIIVEEYIEGKEVKMILFGDSKKIKLYGARKVLINNNDYFNNEVLDVSTKSNKNITTTSKYESDIDPNFIRNVTNLFTSFNKVEFMRVDFRANSNGLHIIELSPDCSVAKDSTPHKVYQEAKKDSRYTSFLRFLINNSLDQCHQF